MIVQSLSLTWVAHIPGDFLPADESDLSTCGPVPWMEGDGQIHRINPQRPHRTGRNHPDGQGAEETCG